MKLIKELLQETEDLSELPPTTVDDISKNIRKGAKDLEQTWANALELVHWAYEQALVHRPTPNIQAAWKQYEKFIALAVEQLAKHRGITGDWRTITSMEALSMKLVNILSETTNKNRRPADHELDKMAEWIFQGWGKYKRGMRTDKVGDNVLSYLDDYYYKTDDDRDTDLNEVIDRWMKIR